MLFTTKLAALVLTTAATMASQTAAVPAPVGKTLTPTDVFTYLDTTHANVTFLGKPLPRDAPLSPDDVLLMYCSTTTGNVCSDPCTIYYGPPACLYAPNTNCLGGSADFYFCNGDACDGICNEYASCGVWMNGAFCLTPGTNSIWVPAA